MFIIIFFNKEYQEDGCLGKGDYCLYYTSAHYHDEGD